MATYERLSSSVGALRECSEPNALPPFLPAEIWCEIFGYLGFSCGFRQASTYARELHDSLVSTLNVGEVINKQNGRYFSVEAVNPRADIADAKSLMESFSTRTKITSIVFNGLLYNDKGRGGVRPSVLALTHYFADTLVSLHIQTDKAASFENGRNTFNVDHLCRSQLRNLKQLKIKGFRILKLKALFDFISLQGGLVHLELIDLDGLNESHFQIYPESSSGTKRPPPVFPIMRSLQKLYIRLHGWPWYPWSKRYPLYTERCYQQTADWFSLLCNLVILCFKATPDAAATYHRSVYPAEKDYSSLESNPGTLNFFRCEKLRCVILPSGMVAIRQPGKIWKGAADSIPDPRRPTGAILTHTQLYPDPRVRSRWHPI